MTYGVLKYISYGFCNSPEGALRHTNPATTQIYLKGIEEEMRLKNNIESKIDEIL